MYLKTFGVVKYKDEEVRTMVNVTSTYLTATQVMEILGRQYHINVPKESLYYKVY